MVAAVGGSQVHCVIRAVRRDRNRLSFVACESGEIRSRTGLIVGAVLQRGGVGYDRIGIAARRNARLQQVPAAKLQVAIRADLRIDAVDAGPVMAELSAVMNCAPV